MFFMQTDVGRCRTSNQDAMASGQLGKNACWAAVCDGMGGANGGNVASAKCIRVLENQIKTGFRPDMSEKSACQLLETALYNANAVVYANAQENEALEGMGTTAVLILQIGNMLHIAHVGDSRILLFHDGKLQRLTRDHSLVQEMIDAGEMSEEEAKIAPNRHVITRAVGILPTVEHDYGSCLVEDGDLVLLCSDGLTNAISEQDLQTMMTEIPKEDLAARLIDFANHKGGEDNITAVVLSVEIDSEET